MENTLCAILEKEGRMTSPNLLAVVNNMKYWINDKPTDAVYLISVLHGLHYRERIVRFYDKKTEKHFYKIK